jgi:hypothetical protein
MLAVGLNHSIPTNAQVIRETLNKTFEESTSGLALFWSALSPSSQILGFDRLTTSISRDAMLNVALLRVMQVA